MGGTLLWPHEAVQDRDGETSASLFFSFLGSGVFSAIVRIFKEEGILGFFVYVSCLNTVSCSQKMPVALLVMNPTSLKGVVLSSLLPETLSDCRTFTSLPRAQIKSVALTELQLDH